MSFSRVCCPTSIMECHDKSCQTVYLVKGQWQSSMANFFRLYVLSKLNDNMPHPTSFIGPYVLFKGHDGMPLPKSFDHMCFPKAMMLWNARHCATVCVVQDLWWPTMPDVVLPCVQSKAYNGMPCPTSFIRVCSKKEMMVLPQSTFSDIMWCPIAMMMCHTRHHTIVCFIQSLWLHSTPGVIL